MFNFIEKLEKEEKEYLKEGLTENIEVITRTIRDLYSIVRSKEDKRVILDALAEICTNYDVGTTDKYNFKDLKGLILEKTNFIQDHIAGKVESRLSTIRQQNHDNKAIREQRDRLQKRNDVLEGENGKYREEINELSQAKAQEEKPEEKGEEAKKENNPFVNFAFDPVILENHGGGPLNEKEIKEGFEKLGDMIIKDIIKDMEKHNKKYSKGGPVNHNCRPNPFKTHKIEIREGGQGGGKNFFKNLFNNKK